MPLILPNTIQNAIPADGDKLGQNFNAITSWANQEAISRDGSTAMTAPLLLPGAPTQPNQAATKAYVDTASGFLAEMRMYAGDTAPTNWMLCQGQAISRATYAALFAIISTRFGTGDGSTTFNLPDMRGRLACGVNASGSYLSAGVGERYGTKDAILPYHAHTGVNHLHAFSGQTGGQSATHAHTTDEPGVSFLGWGPAGSGNGQLAAGGNYAHTPGATAGADSDHSHGYSGMTAGADRSLDTAAAGSDPTNGNLPPLVTFNYIMRVL